MTNLTAQDRCDRCGAQAVHLVRFASGLGLLFCNHHFVKHSKALAQVTS